MSGAQSVGLQTAHNTASDFSAHEFLIKMAINKIWVSTLVQVKAVTNAGGLSPVGYVDVQPMVNMLDGANNATPHGTIYHIPYLRLQGGTNAIILDPVINDIGICVFAHSDITSVKNTGAISNPNSGRNNAPADGLYIGGVLNGVPQQYIMFAGGGISVISPTKVTISAPNLELDGSSGITIKGKITSDSDAVFAGISVDNHYHTDPQGGVTTPPIAGT